MKGKRVLVVGAMRSPIGSGRKDSPLLPLSPQDLALQVLNNLFKKVNLNREKVEAFRVGSVVSLKSDKISQAPAREIALRAGMFNASSNIAEKACSSGLLAIAQAANAIKYGEAEIAIGGGVDMMSNAAEGAALSALTDPITKKNMAQLSDLKARELGFTKEDYDTYADESYKRAKEHLYDYAEFMEPAYIPCQGQEAFCLTFDQNVMIREEILIKLQRKIIGGCEITNPYHASKYADGSAFLMLASPYAVKKFKLTVFAELISYAEYTLWNPKDFIIAPIYAVAKALDASGLTCNDVGSFWINEAFPGSPLAFKKHFFGSIVNPWGGAVAFGHPLGATGAILSVNAICQARKEKKKYFVVSLCNAIAEATAAIFKIY